MKNKKFIFLLIISCLVALSINLVLIEQAQARMPEWCDRKHCNPIPGSDQTCYDDWCTDKPNCSAVCSYNNECKNNETGGYICIVTKDNSDLCIRMGGTWGDWKDCKWDVVGNGYFETRYCSVYGYYQIRACNPDDGDGDGDGEPAPTPIVDCQECSDTYRFAKENWRAYNSCSGSRVSGSTYYTKDCSCSMNSADNGLLACYPNENYDAQCPPAISSLKLYDSTGFKEVRQQETTQGEEYYVSLYQRFRIPGSQALVNYTATRAVNCSLDCEYLSLDYIQEGIGPEHLPYACNKDASGNVSFIEDNLYSGIKASFPINLQYRGLVKYNLTCYGPEGGPNCGHTTPYEDSKTINLVLYDFTYREVSPNEIINYLRNQLASISQIINQNFNTLREIVKI